ncbi:hypothetical protein Q5P01_009229 [Channa striata]|uniref:Protein Wnt n=1 Tax=Channa striata TaxID=64152 RepID=A0AA88T048_CHASR|nr:hypothetical protein Q5P01_009229 [Channa striata]
MELLNLLAAVVLSMCCHFQPGCAWTVNNFLVTGPKAFLTYTSSVQEGAKNGIQECKHQFMLDRWNCPETTLQLSTHNGLRSATRETSFVHAISAAGVMYTLTKNCSMGDFENCGCDDSRIGQNGGRGWIWGGCSDNVAFGEKMSKQFVDALEYGHDSRAAVNLHNNEAGRLAIKATMRKSCKCHGLSGSCSVQTCWMQLADFREVGNYLKIKYEQATKLELDKKRLRAGNSADSRGATVRAFRNIPKSELIYLEDSPNYCIKNRSLGLKGTEGRECVKADKNKSLWERKSCRRLCYECGLTVVEKRTEAYLTYARSVQVGTQSGIDECKHQFAWDKWNCPDSATQFKGLSRATRETSFIHAISAAGVMYTLTKNCSLGELDNCGCDESKNGKIGGRGWLWGGCSDNVGFGEMISKQFVDAQETGQDSRAAVNLHNNEAGRLAVKATMKRICRCHGMSESCTIQTCWTQLSDFRDVGNYLKIKHSQAQKLDIDNGRIRAGNSAENRVAIADALGSIARTELIYLEDSPDYCRTNVTLGLYGTEGRQCLQHGEGLTPWEKRSCRRLCHECGLRVEERRTEVVTSCNCKFQWCCTVNCDDCSQVTVKHVCAKRDDVHGLRRRLRGPK